MQIQLLGIILVLSISILPSSVFTVPAITQQQIFNDGQNAQPTMLKRRPVRGIPDLAQLFNGNGTTDGMKQFDFKMGQAFGEMKKEIDVLKEEIAEMKLKLANCENKMDALGKENAELKEKLAIYENGIGGRPLGG